MSKAILQKILDHIDKDEIINKLILGISEKDIHEWLKAKYNGVSDSKIILAEKSLKIFKSSYLDVYSMIKKDLVEAKKSKEDPEYDLALTLSENSVYKGKIMELANQEVDIKKMMTNLLVAIETRAAQVFDIIQEDPRNLDGKEERILGDLFDKLGVNLERYNKLVLGAPDQVVQHNVTVQHIDQHVQIVQEAIKETLAEMDVETSLKFMDLFTQKLSRLRAPTEKQLTTEARLTEAKVISDTINDRLNKDN